MMAIVAAGLAVSGQNLVTFVVAAVLWFGCIGIFRQVAKADPQMSRVYLRQLRYRGYYPPRSRPYRDAEPHRAASHRHSGRRPLLYWML